jgi:hypothetical protein
LLRLQREIASLLEQTAETQVLPNPPVPHPTKAKPSQTRPAVSLRPATPAKKPASNLLTRVFKVKSEKTNELAEKLMRGLTEFGFADNTRVSPDAQTGAIVVQGDGHAMNFASEFLEALSDESQTEAPKVTAPPKPAASPNRPALEYKLLELDLREAELGLQVAKAEHDQMAEIRKRTPGALSENELRHSQLKVELAQVQVERTKVRLEALQSASPPPTPASPRR